VRVIIPQTVFDARLGHSEYLALLDIFISCENEQRHVLITIPAYDDADPQSPLARWLAPMPPALKQGARNILQRGILADRMQPTGIAEIWVVAPGAQDVDWGRARLGIKDAARVLRRPFKLLLENRRGDWAFLLRPASPTQRRDLEQARKNGWLEVQGGGMGEMKRELEILVTAPPDDSAAWAAKMRLWVMFDRDAHPQDRAQPSQQSNEIRALCEDPAMSHPWSLGFHQLRRRAIENYLPIKVLRAWQRRGSGRQRTQRRTAIDALAALATKNALAHWQYNMKHGLLGDLHGDVRHEIRGQAREIRDQELDPLFQGLDRDERRALASGFGSDIGDLYQEERIWREPGHDQAFQREYGRDPSNDRDTVMQGLFARM